MLQQSNIKQEQMQDKPKSLQDKFYQHFMKCLVGQQISKTLHSFPDLHSHHKQLTRILEPKDTASELHQLSTNAQYYVSFLQKMQEKGSSSEQLIKRMDLGVGVVGFSLNINGFLNTIELLGTYQQAKFWRGKVLNGEVIGSYAQTQFGHGSDVQGLQLEAHYHEKDQSWLIRSPTVSSTKWFASVLGYSGTHAVVYAKTFIKRKNIGLNAFVIEIRDAKLRPVANIKVGDVGPKIGMEKTDTGYLHISGIKVPYESMLMKYHKIRKNGEYEIHKKQQKLAYGTMLHLRIQTANYLAFMYMLMPAIKFWQVRKDARQVIEACGMAFGIIFANQYLMKLYQEFMRQLSQGNHEFAGKLMAKCHIMSSTFKVLSSELAVKYSKDFVLASKEMSLKGAGLVRFFQTSIPATTYEGDNSVLLQQAVRSVLFAPEVQQIPHPKTSLISPQKIEDTYSFLCFLLYKEIKRIKSLISSALEQGRTLRIIWDELYQQQIINLGRLWGMKNLVFCYMEEKYKNTNNMTIYDKIGMILCQKILQSMQNYAAFYGFTVEKCEAWKSINSQQMETFLQFKYPFFGERIQKISIYSQKVFSSKPRL